MILPPDKHNPRNNDCPHNADTEQACSCPSNRKRKEYRTLRLSDPTASHRVRTRFVLHAYCKNGVLIIREAGRTSKSAVAVQIAGVYERALMAKARAAIFAKRLAKAERKKARRKANK